MRRRELLRWTGTTTLALLGGPPLFAAGCRRVTAPELTPFGPLLAPDANGLRLPAGFTSRIIATTGERVGPEGYVWHALPDGGATFAMPDGGWIYVSNCEVDRGGGGVGMVRFDAEGTIVGARSILQGTRRNCAGGAMPWGTWLSCEEVSTGRVWECDPTGERPAVVRPALGAFTHEAATAVPDEQAIYLTEDLPDGGLYRFRPERWGDLSAGVLEILTRSNGSFAWSVIPDPSGRSAPTRKQVPDVVRFDGGEGLWLQGDEVLLTTKGDDRVWAWRFRDRALRVLYDRHTTETPVLSGVDNIVGNAFHTFVAEDGGDMQIVALDSAGVAKPVLQLMGTFGSEIAGPAFSPDGTRLYFSSQRDPGRTYEVRGDFSRGE